MGTASTMGLLAEILGHDAARDGRPPGARQPAARAAHETGRLAVEMVGADRRPSTILLGGVVPQRDRRPGRDRRLLERGRPPARHRRAGSASRSTLDDFDRIGARVPLIVDLQPAGRFLMDDLHRAGGLLAALREVGDLLDPSALTVTGRPLVEYVEPAVVWDREVIRSRSEPVQEDAGIVVLRGNLAPDGAIIKPAAATPSLLQHRGRALVFDSIEDFHARVDDPDLDVDKDTVMVLRGCGPKGYPGMPEVSNLPLPRSCLPRASATWSGSAMGG